MLVPSASPAESRTVTWQEGDALLLGAGASAEADVPMSFQMTQRILDGIIGSARAHSQEAAALSFVCATLLAAQAAKGNASQDLDVEQVFSAVELLAERAELEVAPFVAAWHPAVGALDQPMILRQSFDQRFIDAITSHITGSGGITSFYDLVAELIDSSTGAGAGGTYRRLTVLMLTQLRAAIGGTEKKVDYLRPLARRGAEPHGITVATLNYDRAVEIACTQDLVPVETGIGSWIASGAWRWPDRGVRLLKLHGSIDWSWANEKIQGNLRNLPRKVVVVDGNHQQLEPALVFGHRGKLRAEGPFLSLLAEFERQLGNAKRLIIIGYSFRDDHVNEVITRWTAESSERTLLAVDPYWPDGYFEPRNFRQALSTHLNPPQFRRRLAGPEVEFEPRFENWKMTCGEALARLGAGRSD